MNFSTLLLYYSFYCELLQLYYWTKLQSDKLLYSIEYSCINIVNHYFNAVILWECNLVMSWNFSVIKTPTATCLFWYYYMTHCILLCISNSNAFEWMIYDTLWSALKAFIQSFQCCMLCIHAEWSCSVWTLQCKLWIWCLSVQWLLLSRW